MVYTPTHFRKISNNYNAQRNSVLTYCGCEEDTKVNLVLIWIKLLPLKFARCCYIGKEKCLNFVQLFTSMNCYNAESIRLNILALNYYQFFQVLHIWQGWSCSCQIYWCGYIANIYPVISFIIWIWTWFTSINIASFRSWLKTFIDYNYFTTLSEVGCWFFRWLWWNTQSETCLPRRQFQWIIDKHSIFLQSK